MNIEQVMEETKAAITHQRALGAQAEVEKLKQSFIERVRKSMEPVSTHRDELLEKQQQHLSSDEESSDLQDYNEYIEHAEEQIREMERY